MVTCLDTALSNVPLKLSCRDPWPRSVSQHRRSCPLGLELARKTLLAAKSRAEIRDNEENHKYARERRGEE
jgi:hypothetical protein